MSGSLVILEDFDPNAVNLFEDEDHEQLMALQQAREEGHREGFEEGKAAGLAEADEAAIAIKNVCDAVEEKLNGLNERVEREVTTTLRDLLNVLYPTLMKTAFAKEIAAFLSEADFPLGEAKIKLHVHPELTQSLEPLMQGLNESERLELIADEAQPLGVAVAEWENGGTKFDIDSIHSKVESILNEAAECQDESDEK